MSLFRLQRASLGYGQAQVLRDISLTIDEGEHVALVGKSGCGKSTLLEHLHAQQRDTSALCSQKPGLVMPLSVYHNVYMGQLQQHGALYNLLNLLRPWPSHKAAIMQLLAQLGLADKLMWSLDRLSGGQQQRTAIARALYQQQSIFIGDEPFSSVDPSQAAELLNTIRARHRCSVIALHNKELALSGFTRVIGLQQGQICFDRPAHAVTTHDLDALYRA